MYKDNMKLSFSYHSNDILFERSRKIFAGILITHDCNVKVEIEHHVLLFTMTNNPKDLPVKICFYICLTLYYHFSKNFFFSMRSKDANQSLNEDMFHKLTGGWV